MNQTINIQKTFTKNEAREQLKLQLARYLEQLPESTRAAHKWMKRLEAASLGVVVAVFILALYVSIAWKSFNPAMIALAWFAYAVSFAPIVVLIGIHSIILRASPPVLLPGKAQRFLTGAGAVWAGVGYIVGGLAFAAFWGLFAYATWTQSYELLKPLIGFLGVVMGVGIAASILYSMISTTFQKLFKSR